MATALDVGLFAMAAVATSSGGSTAATSTSQWDFLEEEYYYQSGNHEPHTQDKDIVDTLRQANLHCFNSDIEERQALLSLNSGKVRESRVRTSIG